MTRKSASGIFLMELMLVILFLSLSAIVVLRLFMVSNRESRESEALTRAVAQAQDAAESFHSGGRTVFQQSPWQCSDDRRTYLCYYDREWRNTTEERAAYVLEVRLDTQDGEAGILENGEITVRLVGEQLQDDVLCSLPLGRYTPRLQG